MPFGVVQGTVYSFSFGSQQKFINKNIICTEPNLPITTPIYKNGFLLYARSDMTVKARRTWALLDLQQNCISNLVWTGLLDPCGSLLINKSFCLSCTGKLKKVGESSCQVNLSIGISDEIEVAVIAFDENKTILSFKFISILITGTCYQTNYY